MPTLSWAFFYVTHKAYVLDKATWPVREYGIDFI